MPDAAQVELERGEPRADQQRWARTGATSADDAHREVAVTAGPAATQAETRLGSLLELELEPGPAPVVAPVQAAQPLDGALSGGSRSAAVSEIETSRGAAFLVPCPPEEAATSTCTSQSLSLSPERAADQTSPRQGNSGGGAFLNEGGSVAVAAAAVVAAVAAAPPPSSAVRARAQPPSWPPQWPAGLAARCRAYRAWAQSCPTSPQQIVYWVQLGGFKGLPAVCARVRDNLALKAALSLREQYGLPVVALCLLPSGQLARGEQAADEAAAADGVAVAGARAGLFLGLAAALRRCGVPTLGLYCEGRNVLSALASYTRERAALAVICAESHLPSAGEQLTKIARALPCPLLGFDADCAAPLAPPLVPTPAPAPGAQHERRPIAGPDHEGVVLAQAWARECASARSEMLWSPPLTEAAPPESAPPDMVARRWRAVDHAELEAWRASLPAQSHTEHHSEAGVAELLERVRQLRGLASPGSSDTDLDLESSGSDGSEGKAAPVGKATSIDARGVFEAEEALRAPLRAALRLGLVSPARVARLAPARLRDEAVLDRHEDVRRFLKAAAAPALLASGAAAPAAPATPAAPELAPTGADEWPLPGDMLLGRTRDSSWNVLQRRLLKCGELEDGTMAFWVQRLAGWSLQREDGLALAISWLQRFLVGGEGVDALARLVQGLPDGLALYSSLVRAKRL
jgi:hypothetical protein